MIALALAALPYLKSYWRVMLVALAVLCALAWFAFEKHKWTAAGTIAERARIESANKVESDRAIQAAKNVDDCFNAGGNWDRDLGVCNRAAR